MPKTTEVKIRVDQKVKEQVAELYAHWGLDLTDAVNIFFRQSIDCGGLPFELSRCDGLKLSPTYQIMTPDVVDGAALVPADWDDPEDDVYDRYAG